MEWIKIEKEMPESVQSRIIKGDGKLDPDKSVKVLIYTDAGSIYKNQRIKMLVGEKEWVWVMGVEGEKITHWSRFLSPVIEVEVI